MMSTIRKVVVGISGGVDSAVAAFLLKRQGFDICGAFMRNWDDAGDEETICSLDEDYEDAKYICNTLDIPLKSVNFVKEYWNHVFLDMLSDYENGFTPNPDINCNKHIKFNYFVKYATNVLKADAIATGHYANTNLWSNSEFNSSNKDIFLLRSKDVVKDQTFFLCQLDQNTLKKIIFPLANLKKEEVKLIASKNGLDRISKKRESMGICFIGNTNFQQFISRYVPDKPGNFIDIDTGKIVGKHYGLHMWTVGQRSKIAGQEKPFYIAKKDVLNNIIYVAKGAKNPAMHTYLFFTSNPHWIGKRPYEDGDLYKCQFKFQHTHDPVYCKLFETRDGLLVLLDKPKRAIVPGQYAVFYDSNRCLGSARIIHSGISNFSLYYLRNYKYRDS